MKRVKKIAKSDFVLSTRTGGIVGTQVSHGITFELTSDLLHSPSALPDKSF